MSIFPSSQLPPYSPHATILSTFIICHRWILGSILSVILRIGLAVGLLRIKVKAKQKSRSGTRKTNDDGQSEQGDSKKAEEQDRLDIRIYPLRMLLGTSFGRKSGLCSMRHALNAQVKGDGASSCSGSAATSDCEAGAAVEHAAGLCDIIVKTITSVQVRKCRIGSVGLSILPATNSYSNISNSNHNDGKSRALLGLSFGCLHFEAKLRVDLDSSSMAPESTHIRREDESYGTGSNINEMNGAGGSYDHQRYNPTMSLNVAFRLDSIRFALISIEHFRSWISGGGKGKSGTQRDVFDPVATILSGLVPAVSLSESSVTAAINVAAHDSIVASVSLGSFSVCGTQLPSSGQLDGNGSDIPTNQVDGSNGAEIILGLQSLGLKVIGGKSEDSNVSASISSMDIALSKVNGSLSSTVLRVKQTNGSSTEERGRSKLIVGVGLSALVAIVASANDAKVILAALASVQKLKRRGVSPRPTSSKARKSRHVLLLGEVLVRLALKACIRDDIISASGAASTERESLAFASNVDMDCSLLDQPGSDVKASHCIRATTATICVNHSTGSSPGERDAVLHIGNAHIHYVPRASKESEEDNTMKVRFDAFSINANDAQIIFLARISRIAKTRSQNLPSVLIHFTKKPKKQDKSGAPRIELSCQRAQVFIEGCSVEDGSAANTARYVVTTNGVGLSFTPKCVSGPSSTTSSRTDGQDSTSSKTRGDRDHVKVGASDFDVSVTITPQLTLPLHHYTNEDVEDAGNDDSLDAKHDTCKSSLYDDDQNPRPVTFTVSTTGATLQAFLGSASHRKERNRIRVGVNEEPPPPHEEIDVYVETILLRETFEDIWMSSANDAAITSNEDTRIIEATKVGVSVVATRNEEGATFPRCLVRNVSIDSHGPLVRGTWSPVLQQYIALIEMTTKGMIKRYQTMFKSHPPPSNKKTVDVVIVAIRVIRSLLDIRVHLGQKSVLDLIAKSFTVDVVNNPQGLWKKPTVRIAGSGLSGHLKDFEQEVFSLDNFNFDDVLRHATSDEVSTYESKIDDGHHGEANAVVSDINGRPLMEEIGLNLGGTLRITVPPVLHMGEVIDDISINAKTMFMALRQAGLLKPQSCRKYQLMKISAGILFADGTLLEPVEDGRLTAAECFDMLHLSIEKLALSVERLTPPSCTQTRLNSLDEDKRRQYEYGPVVQGGDTHLSVRHAVCTLYPLTLATPLVVLDEFVYAGLFMMAGLNPDTPGLVQRHPFGFRFNCHHKTVHDLSSPDALRERSSCGCRYGVTVTSCSAQPKMFFDGTISCLGMDGSYGMVVLDSIPKLQNIIKRLQPPPSPSSAPASQIGWWDNLRFLIHGNIRLAVERLCFRFLLDTPARYDWSVLLQCSDYVLDHATGGMDVSMSDATLTVPGLPYHLTFKEQQKDSIPNALSAICGLDSKGGRHSLLLVPRLEAKIGFDWVVRCPGKAKSTDHHSPYFICDPLPTFLSDDDFAALSADKFYRFKSLGVNLDVSLKLATTDSFNTWLALRVDVLPWLTHKILSALPPPSESEADGPGPLPIVDRLSFQAEAADIHMACWFDDDDDEESQSDDVEAERNGGICLLIPSVMTQYENTGETHIQINGLVKTALLDIDYDSFYGKQIIPSFAREEGEDMLAECDEIVGAFGAASEATRVAEVPEQALSVALDDSNEVQDSSAHSIFHHLQQWARNITDLDSVLLVDRIDILSTPLSDLMFDAQLQVQPTKNDDDASFSKSKQKALWHESQQPWTVLVGGLKVLWTLEIRDALLSLSQDLMLTLDYMKLSVRQALPSRGKDDGTTDAESTIGEAEDKKESDIDIDDDASVSSESYDMDHILNCKSSLGYLLDDKSPLSSRAGSPLLEKPAFSRSTTVQQARQSNSGTEARIAQNATMPTLDVHLSNPQIQLHSEHTGGSVILAMRGAYIDGQRYLNLIDPDNGLSSSTSIESLLQKTEFQYTLDKMEIYAIVPGVDVDAGLQWLNFHDENEGLEPLDSNDSDDDELPSILPSISMQGGPAGIPESSEARMANTGRRRFRPQFCIYDPRVFQKPPLLQLIMNRCTFDSRQVFHRHPHHLSSEEILAYVSRGHLEPLLEAALDQVDLHIDEMSFMLDAHQYITTFDLIRNVLLEPPKISKKREERLFADPNGSASLVQDDAPIITFASDEGQSDDATQVKVEEIVQDWNARFPRPRDGLARQRKRIRHQLRAASQELMGPLEQQHLLSRNNCNRLIKYTLGKLKWQIQSHDYLDEVTIDFTGFRGQHEFIIDGAVVSNISLEDVQVMTATPGPDALAFYDPFIILACEVQGENPCTRCGVAFNRSTNEARSCVHHAGSYVFGPDGMRYWTCCASSFRDAPGCVARPHAGREKAAVIRIETLPGPVKGLRMYKHLEINFYPNVQHKFIVQITKDLASLFMAYFLGVDESHPLDDDEDDVDSDDDDDEEEEANSILEAPSDFDDASSLCLSQVSSSSPAHVVGQSRKMPPQNMITSSAGSKKGSNKKSALLGSYRGDQNDKSSSRSGGRRRRLSRREGEVVASSAAADSPRPPQEIAFIKFWRIGHIHASISVSGFAIVTNDLGILIPAFSKAYKVGRNNYLGRKYVSHLIHEVVKSAASSGMQKVKRKFIRHGKSRSAMDDDKAKRLSTTTGTRRGTLDAARADLLLGGSGNNGKAPRSNRGRLYTT